MRKSENQITKQDTGAWLSEIRKEEKYAQIIEITSFRLGSMTNFDFIQVDARIVLKTKVKNNRYIFAVNNRLLHQVNINYEQPEARYQDLVLNN